MKAINILKTSSVFERDYIVSKETYRALPIKQGQRSRAYVPHDFTRTAAPANYTPQQPVLTNEPIANEVATVPKNIAKRTSSKESTEAKDNFTFATTVHE